MTLARQFAKSSAQNCRGIAKGWGGDVAFKEGRISLLLRLMKVIEDKIRSVKLEHNQMKIEQGVVEVPGRYYRGTMQNTGSILIGESWIVMDSYWTFQNTNFFGVFYCFKL